MQAYSKTKARKQAIQAHKSMVADDKMMARGYHPVGQALGLLEINVEITDSRIKEFRQAGSRRRLPQKDYEEVRWLALEACVRSLKVNVDMGVLSYYLFKHDGVEVEVAALKKLSLAGGIYLIGGFSCDHQGHVFVAEVGLNGISVRLYEKTRSTILRGYRNGSISW